MICCNKKGETQPHFGLSFPGLVCSPDISRGYVYHQCWWAPAAMSTVFRRRKRRRREICPCLLWPDLAGWHLPSGMTRLWQQPPGIFIPPFRNMLLQRSRELPSYLLQIFGFFLLEGLHWMDKQQLG